MINLYMVRIRYKSSQVSRLFPGDNGEKWFDFKDYIITTSVDNACYSAYERLYKQFDTPVFIRYMIYNEDERRYWVAMIRRDLKTVQRFCKVVSAQYTTRSPQYDFVVRYKKRMERALEYIYDMEV